MTTPKKRPLTIREEANALVCSVFRNGYLENLHAGKSSRLLNNSDLSRITDAEMKALMIEASTQLARLLWMREHDPEAYWRTIEFFDRYYCGEWAKDDVDGSTPAQRIFRDDNGELVLRPMRKPI